MATFDSRGGAPSDIREASDPFGKERIRGQLDEFTKNHDIPSLHDRLRIGLNEVAMLAFDKTNELIQQLTEKMTDSPERAHELYQNLVDMCVYVQTRGPWAYAEEFSNPNSLEGRAWFTLVGSESIGYDREMDLNDVELKEDIGRIMGHLTEAIDDPESFYQKSRAHLQEEARGKIRYDKKDKEKVVPIGEGFSAFLPMAIQGYEAGVVQDGEGWVYVGARKEISDDLIESVGLEKIVEPDDRDKNRTITGFYNSSGVRVIKKIHPGLLVIETKKFEPAIAVTRAINERREMLEMADEALGHVRVIQTSEKKRDGEDAEDDPFKGDKDFMRISSETRASEELSDSTALSRPREDFYRNMHFVRSNYVFIDALKKLYKKRKEAGKEVTAEDKEALSKYISNKMLQKVEELRHVNGIIDEELERLPEEVKQVYDMAGGAGDLGLAVTNELLSMGREVEGVEIVDPQEGVDDFMRTIIDYLPFREDLEKIAKHALDDGTGFLQDTEIAPDSIVVAKHACGTLTDAIIEQWTDSESHMLVAMTCCQGKAKDQPARYGFSQSEWSRLCRESDATNTKTDGLQGKELKVAQGKLERGNRAMKKLDMARVEYLRRHGFAAELDITDKFPKGDTIIARRLPPDFMKRLAELKELEAKDPLKFDAQMMRLDLLAAGRELNDEELGIFGDGWTKNEFTELTRRFIAPAFEEYHSVDASKDKDTADNAGQEKKEAKKLQRKLMRQVFNDTKGKIHLYVRGRADAAGKTIEGKQMGPIIGAIKNRLFRNVGESQEDIRAGVDAIMTEMGY